MKKMTWKRRMVSALLALSMVASFLPAGLLPKAEALVFTGASLNIESDGGFTATFTSAANIDALGVHYFALVPDLKLNADGMSVSEAIENNYIDADTRPGNDIKTANTWELLKGQLKNLCGFKDADFSESAGFLWSENVSLSDVRSSDNKSLIFKNTASGSGTKKLPSIDTIQSYYQKEYGTNVNNGGIPYVAIFVSQQGTYKLASAQSTYSGSGLKADPDHIDIIIIKMR